MLSQPELHASLESKSRITPNNNRYTAKDSSEDDIILKLSSEGNTPALDFDDFNK